MFKFLLSIAGFIFVVFFCISASATVTSTPNVLGNFLSEPMTMIFFGAGLIGMDRFVKSWINR